MPVYTVHAPVDNGADLAATDKFAFVRDGFHFWALVFGRALAGLARLWLALIGWIVLTVAVDVGLTALGVGQRRGHARQSVAVALLMGLRRRACGAGRCRGANGASSISSWPTIEEAAERRFFERWTAAARPRQRPMAVDRGGPPPTRNVPGQPFSKPPPLPQGGIIGLFPEPGGSR